jgi:hypothetical protein
VKIPEARLDQVVGLFLAERVFGARRAELLAAQLPDADAAPPSGTPSAPPGPPGSASWTRRRTRRSSAWNNSHPTPLIPPRPRCGPDHPPVRRPAHPREQAWTELDTLTAEEAPKAAAPALLDELPLAGDVVPGLDPVLKAPLFGAFDLQVLWDKTNAQVPVGAEIIDATSPSCPPFSTPP